MEPGGVHKGKTPMMCLSVPIGHSPELLCCLCQRVPDSLLRPLAHSFLKLLPMKVWSPSFPFIPALRCTCFQSKARHATDNSPSVWCPVFSVWGCLCRACGFHFPCSAFIRRRILLWRLISSPFMLRRFLTCSAQFHWGIQFRQSYGNVKPGIFWKTISTFRNSFVSFFAFILGFNWTTPKVYAKSGTSEIKLYFQRKASKVLTVDQVGHTNQLLYSFTLLSRVMNRGRL